MPSQTLILSIEIDAPLVPAADIPSLMSALSDFAPYLPSASQEIAQEQREDFATSGSFFGDPWPGLAASTIREKERHGYSAQAEIRRGEIENQIGKTILLSASSVTVGIDHGAVPYAGVQDAGNAGRHIPPRVLVAITPGMITMLEDRLRQYIEGIVGHPVPGFSITAQLQ